MKFPKFSNQKKVNIVTKILEHLQVDSLPSSARPYHSLTKLKYGNIQNAKEIFYLLRKFKVRIFTRLFQFFLVGTRSGCNG